MTDWLTAAGTSAPRILHHRAEDGLLLLEDFGDRSVKSVLTEHTKGSDAIFADCIALLLRIRSTIPPDLPVPDAAELVEWTHLADAHYPGVKPERLVGLRHVLRDLLADALNGPKTTSLRDFHTENMMWLPDRSGLRRLGLLDYQDAFLTHPAYDLMSLLTDARTWISKSMRASVIDSYLEQSGDDAGAFRLAFAALSVQRNLRILGIFARAGRHTDHMPNTYRYLVEALTHPAFDTVREDALSALPPPEQG